VSIGIGIYTEQGELIGYKCDSFWTLTKEKEHLKPDWLENGSIRKSLIKNLNAVLAGKWDNAPITGPILKMSRSRQHTQYETRLLGYIALPDGEPVFTHRIFEREAQELDEEDKAVLAQRLRRAA
jgi:hypothetical protein